MSYGEPVSRTSCGTLITTNTGWGITSENVYLSGQITTPKYELYISSGFNTEEALSLYKVYLINLDTDEIIERNVMAKNQANAQVKALLAEKIAEPDDYFCHVVHICGLPESND